MSDIMRSRRTIICGPADCPVDSRFEHDNYYGCVPKTFSPTTGKARGFRQRQGPDGRWYWNGGCKAAELQILLSSNGSGVRPLDGEG